METGPALSAGAAVLVTATLLVYLRALQAGFIWDDDVMLTGNRLVTEPGRFWSIWFATHLPDYFPLTSTSFWIEYRLWGSNPFPYHLTNVLLHGLSATLIWRVLRRLELPGAWWAALIFAVHPVNVESVAWVAERKNTLAMFFYALALLFYLRFDSPALAPSIRSGFWQHGPLARGEHSRQGRQGLGARADYAFSLVAFVLALLSKTAVVMLPVVLLLCVWWRRGATAKEGNPPAGAADKRRLSWKDLLRTAPFFAASTVLGLVTIWFQYQRSIQADVVNTAGFVERLLGAARAVWFYLAKAVVPVKLTFVYPRWEIDPLSVVSWLPLVAAVGVFGLAWCCRRSWGRPMLFASGYFVLMLLPVLGFLNVYFQRFSLVADHWQYFALIGVVALAVGALGSQLGVQSTRFRVAAAASTVALAVLTWHQTRIYASAESLWQDTLKKNPACWLAHNNLGTLLEQRGNYEAAVARFQAALRFHPDYALAHNNLGGALLKLGRVDDALPHLHRALDIHPGYADAHENLGKVLIQLGRLEEAATHFKACVRSDPRRADAHYNLGNYAFGQERFDDAVLHYRLATRAGPDHALAYHNLGMTLVALGRLDEAAVEFNTALRVQPDFARAKYQLAELAVKRNRLEDAAQWFAAAAQDQPDAVEPLDRLASVLVALGRTSEGIGYWREAIRLKPDGVEALRHLAWTLATHQDAQVRDGTEAVTLASRAVQLTRTNDAIALDTLAAANAESGRFEQAVAAGRRALALAKAAESPVAEQIQERLERYESGRPYHE